MRQKEYIGARIREFRKSRLAISQEGLAALLDPPVTRQAVQSWEAGRTTPDAETLLQLCRLMGAEISDFYMGPSASAAGGPDEGEAEVVSAYRRMSESGRRVLRATASALAGEAIGGEG